MDSGTERPRALRHAALGVTATSLSAIALWHAGGLHPTWWLMWLAPVPVLTFALRWPGSAAVAACASFLAWTGGGLDLWHYYRSTLHVPLPVALVAVTMPAAAFALGVLLARHLVRRGRPLLATLVLPAWWTAFEHLTARLSPHGTFGSLAYTQMELLPIIQIASVCGAAGITYLLMLVASVIAVVTLPTAAPRRRLMLLAIVVVLAAALGFGAWRLAEQRPSTTLQVGLVAADHPAQPATASEAEALTARYAAASATLAEEGADVIVFPETIVRVTAAEAEAVARRFAGGGASAVVAGFALQDDAGERNVALAWDPRSSRLAIYAKQHLLPPFEYRYRPGTQLSLLPLGEGKVTAGLAVCKDLDFPRLGRDYARRGAALLLVPAWDFEVDGWLHSRMAILRGVESGFAVARSARNGRLTLSDDCGRVVAEATSARSDTAVLLAPLAVHARDTLYSRLGDWLGWLCCGVVLLALVALRGHQRRVP